MSLRKQSTEGADVTTAYEKFTSVVQNHVSKNYGVVVPATTMRSAGLNSHQGIIVGCRIDDAPLEDLTDALVGLPPVWKARWSDAIFASFSTHPTSVQALAQRYATIIGQVTTTLRRYDFGTPMLDAPKLRVNASKIIMYGQLNEDAFRLYEDVMKGFPQQGSVRSWGRIVLAEAQTTLTDEEQWNTNMWLSEAMVPQGEIPLAGLLLSAFTVVDETFTLANDRRSLFHIS